MEQLIDEGSARLLPMLEGAAGKLDYHPMLTIADGATAIDLARDRVGLEVLLADMESAVLGLPAQDH